MFERTCFLRLCVSLAIATSTFSAAAQDTTADAAAKAPVPTAQPAADNTAALSKAAQNPVANLMNVSLQDNSNFGVGPNRKGDIFNIQPLIPVKLSEKVLLSNWVIQPIWF